MIEWSAAPTETWDHALLIDRDITAKRAAQREVRRANAQISLILSSITEGCLSLDREWDCTYMNAKAVVWLGWHPQDVLERNLDYFPGATGSAFYNAYHEALRTQRFLHCEATSLATERASSKVSYFSWFHLMSPMSAFGRLRTNGSVRFRPVQTSVCSAISRASSTSIPRYLTVLSSLVCPRSN